MATIADIELVITALRAVDKRIIYYHSYEKTGLSTSLLKQFSSRSFFINDKSKLNKNYPSSITMKVQMTYFFSRNLEKLALRLDL